MTGATYGGSIVILSNRRTVTRRLARTASSPIRVLRLHHTEEIEDIRKELCARPYAQEVSRQALCREHEAEFRGAYIDFMARLSEEHQTLSWMLMPFTSKNPLSSELLQNVFYSILIARLLARETQTLFVLTSNVSLAVQVAHWGAEHGVRVTSAVRGTSRIRRLLKHRFPTAIPFAFFRALVVSMLARSLRPPTSDGESGVVVATTMPQSSVADGKYREAYFAPLVQHLGRTGVRVMVFALISSRAVGTVRQLRRASASPPVVPVEACLTVADLIRCAIRSLRQWSWMPRFASPAVICGVDVRPLLRAAIRDSYQSTSFFRHLSIYVAARRLAERLPAAGWVYPFENRALERALIRGVRDGNPRATVIGCQNAALTLSHLNFMLGSREAGFASLPDVIFTTGAPVREWMVTRGNFPSDRVRVGCAFRQGRAASATEGRDPGPVRRVLVVLASSVDEYVEMLTFVAEAFHEDRQREIRFRPHPEFPFSSAQRLVAVPPRFVYHVSAESLSADLLWADVVLYASSTVSMEAVARGIPAMYVDVGHALSADPLFDRANGLRWAVARPADVLPCLDAIGTLSAAEYQQRARADRDYVDQYFLVPGEDRIQALMEAVHCPNPSQ